MHYCVSQIQVNVVRTVRMEPRSSVVVCRYLLLIAPSAMPKVIGSCITMDLVGEIVTALNECFAVEVRSCYRA